MFRLNKLTDYAVVLLVRFVRAEGTEVLTAGDLTEATGLPLPTVVKVLKLLARGGVLGSSRGTKGGYRLARPAERITMADVVAAMEGPLAITECSAGVCEYEQRCPTRPHWRKINSAIGQALSSVTLLDMACPLPGGIPIWNLHPAGERGTAPAGSAPAIGKELVR